MADRNADIKYSEQMKEQLIKEFDVIDLNHDGYLDKDEIQKLLDQKSSGGVFDRDILTYLFNQINAKDHHSDDRISKIEFCESYIELNIFFHDRVYEYEYKGTEIEKAIKEYEDHLVEARDTERHNKFGIMDNSILTVTVIEALDLKAMDYQGTSDPYCLLQLENQTERTKTVKNTLNPIFEETFTFRVERGSEVLKIIVMDQDDGNDADDFEGQCAIGIDVLRDQQKVEKYIPLQAENPYEKWQGKLRLELRWIHSKVKLIQDLIAEHKNELLKTKEMRREFEDKIYRLKKPFWWMDKNQLKEIEDGDLEAHEYHNNSVARYAATVSDTERVFSTSVNGPVETVARLMGFRVTPWYQCLKLVTYLYLFLTI